METIEKYLENFHSGCCGIDIKNIDKTVVNQFTVSYNVYGDFGLRSGLVLTISLLDLLDFVNGKF